MHFRFSPHLITGTAVSIATLIAPRLTLAQAEPVASWRFDQPHQIGSSVKALAGPNLSLENARYVKDARGDSLILDNRSIVVADPHTRVAAILPRQNMTVSAWVSIDKSQEYGGLVSAVLDDGDLERGWVLGYNKTKFSFALASEGKKRLTYLTGKTNFEPGRWYYVAATYDGKTMSLFVNGVLEAQSTEQNGAILYPEATPFVLGAYRDDNEDFPMEGRLRETQIWRETLSPQQIAVQFQLQAPLTDLPPVLLNGPVVNPSNRKVLIIGTDGTRPDRMEATKTPNIHALIQTGAYSNKAKTRMPTWSGPGWSSMLTGVWSDKHGVKDNTFKGKKYDQYPDFLSRLEKLNPKFNTFAAANWEPLLTTLSGGPLISDNIDVKLAFRGTEAENDKRIADVTSHYLAHEDLDAAFVYFGEVDEMSHAHNPFSTQYTRALEHVDGYVGQLMAAIRSRPTYAQENWLILMSTDHGHVDKGGHGGNSPIETTIFFLANGPDVDAKKLDNPEIVDVGITALAHLGVKVSPAWDLDGKVQALK